MEPKSIGKVSRYFPTLIARYVAHQFLKTTPYRHFSEEDKKFLATLSHRQGKNHCEYEVGGTGKLLIFVHGWNGHGIQFRNVAQHAIAQGYRIVLWTGPGHGTCGPKQSNLGVFFRSLMDSCQHLQNEFGPIHALIGHSFGAMASALAVSHGIASQHLVMVGGPARMMPVVDAIPRRFGLSDAASRFFHSYVQKNARLSPADADLYQLKSLISCRTLWIHDAHDKEISVNEAKDIQPHWPGLHVKITEHLGHRRILKSQEFSNTVLDFIKDS